MQLAQVYEEIVAVGAVLWAISPQEQQLNAALRQKHTLPFPILADSDQTVIRTWGLFNNQDPYQRAIPYPATYIIDMEGHVHWLRIGVTTRERPTAEEVIAALP